MSVIQTFARDFWELSEPFQPKIKKALFWIIVLQMAAIIEPYMILRIVNGIAAGDETIAAMLPEICAAMLAMLVLIGGANIAKNHFIREVWLAIEHDLPVRSGTKLLRLPLVYHQTENTGAVVGRIVRGVHKTGEITGLLMFEVAPLLVQTAVTTVLITYYNPRAAAVFLSVFATFVTLTGLVKVAWAKHRLSRHALDARADETLGEAIANVMTVQAFGQERGAIEQVRSIRDRVLGLAVPEFHAYDRNDFFRHALVSFGRIAVIYVCASSAFAGTFSLGHLIFVITLAERVYSNCYRFGTIFDRGMETVDAVREIRKIQDEAEFVTDPPNPEALPFPIRGAVSVKDVTYAYWWRDKDGKTGRSAKPALAGVSLDVAAGETIGIVGESGGGKSTLAKLLMRFDDPVGGSVCLDGIDLQRLAIHDLRRVIGYVPQEVEIFATSVRANIAYGMPDATTEQIEAAARMANAHEFIMELPDGYDAPLGNRGTTISGGQRQRIGIARAILLNPAILLLDEATSNVDAVSERKIQEAIDQMRAGRTVIIIAHRLSTVMGADRIVVMDRGRIAEIGTHAELNRRNGIYHRLVELQTRVEATI